MGERFGRITGPLLIGSKLVCATIPLRQAKDVSTIGWSTLSRLEEKPKRIVFSI